MARNAEKAMTALARFRQAQLEEGKVKERRPFLASECTELPKAEKWRRQIIGEISKKVAQIQNAGLGEFRIRDLNDEINKLLREKGHWEVRIKELGGPDYGKVGPKMLDHEGKEVPGNRGYKYFGAAKDLPGVRELFEKEPLPPPRKTRAELMKAIDFEYYGYLDEDDGVIVPLEQEYEKRRSLTRRAARTEEGRTGGRSSSRMCRCRRSRRSRRRSCAGRRWSCYRSTPVRPCRPRARRPGGSWAARWPCCSLPGPPCSHHAPPWLDGWDPGVTLASRGDTHVS
uniref:ISY1 splicing factor homolog n=1 Tax=Bos taurus TaxID=9913 RepID=A0AAA9RU81_BOVIN